MASYANVNADINNNNSSGDEAGRRSPHDSLFLTPGETGGGGGGGGGLGINAVDILRISAKEQLTSRDTWRAAYFEFLGTLLAVLLTCSTIFALNINNTATGWQNDNRAVFVVAMSSAATMYGLSSGLFPNFIGLFNPVLATAVWIIGRITYIRLAVSVIAQFLGGIAGAYLSELLTASTASVCTTVSPQISVTQAFFTECLLSFVLCVTVCGMLADRRHVVQRWPSVYGGITLVMVLVGGQPTGGSTNPVRSFAAAVIQDCWDCHWVYWAAPFLGGICAGLMQRFLFRHIGRNTGERSLSRTSSFSSFV